MVQAAVSAGAVGASGLVVFVGSVVMGAGSSLVDVLLLVVLGSTVMVVVVDVVCVISRVVVVLGGAASPVDWDWDWDWNGGLSLQPEMHSSEVQVSESVKHFPSAVHWTHTTRVRSVYRGRLGGGMRWLESDLHTDPPDTDSATKDWNSRSVWRSRGLEDHRSPAERLQALGARRDSDR